eukprot:TRINITY_DN4553_c0_g2_i9.p2 TRINITY_DN4553_c0_g2~~TRINITY_DN4553_c0_g2_i9.p2  ORF type:complete len:527 (+),score=120.48 TRINITY_DN4553_c0_g2_i9:2206-3786(+)
MIRRSLCLLAAVAAAAGEFNFSNTMGDNMVLQQAPASAQVWGLADEVGKSVTVTLQQAGGATEQEIETTTISETGIIIWKVAFDPIKASNDQYSVTATLEGNSSVTAKNILFGDVYICSGQSNMQFTVDQAFNASAEVAAADNFPNVRLYTAAEDYSSVEKQQLWKVQLPWSVASSAAVGGGNWSYFSAVCWFFGRNLNEKLNYPIGLIATTWGGTPIKAWSSSKVLDKCPYDGDSDTVADLPSQEPFKQKGLGNPNKDSCLWNAMIVPFLRTNIKGAIWYQGEADSNPPLASNYACMFPAMINDWRARWAIASNTSSLFPFGFVQISTWGDHNNKTCTSGGQCIDTAIVRHGQLGNYSQVPNKVMPAVFMATGVDLGDPTSPFGDIHPRFKQQVTKRLSDAALNVAYGQDVYYSGPIASSVSLKGSTIEITFTNISSSLQVKNSMGFEVRDATNTQEWGWTYVTSAVTKSSSTTISLSVPSSVTKPVEIRYNWYRSPCTPAVGPYGCAIYDQDSMLPAIPFRLEL